jgi:hypothetical protein
MSDETRERTNREWAEANSAPVDLFGRVRLYHASEAGRKKEGLSVFGTLHTTPQAALDHVRKTYRYNEVGDLAPYTPQKLVVMEVWVPLNLFRLVAMADGGFVGFTRARIPEKDLKITKEKTVNKQADWSPYSKRNMQWAKEHGLETDLFDRVKLYFPVLPNDVVEGLAGGEAGINEGDYVYDSVYQAVRQMRNWYVKKEKLMMFEVWVPFDAFRLDMHGSMAKMVKSFTPQEVDMMPVKFKEPKAGSMFSKDGWKTAAAPRTVPTWTQERNQQWAKELGIPIDLLGRVRLYYITYKENKQNVKMNGLKNQTVLYADLFPTSAQVIDHVQYEWGIDHPKEVREDWEYDHPDGDNEEDPDWRSGRSSNIDVKDMIAFEAWVPIDSLMYIMKAAHTTRPLSPAEIGLKQIDIRKWAKPLVGAANA